MDGTMTGRFQSVDLVRARHRLDGPDGDPVAVAEDLQRRAAEMCAARRRFDGALGREGTGGHESFQPKFSGGRPSTAASALGALAGGADMSAFAPPTVLDLDAVAGTVIVLDDGPEWQRTWDTRDVASAADHRLRRAALADRAHQLLARIDVERGGSGRPPSTAVVRPRIQPTAVVIGPRSPVTTGPEAEAVAAAEAAAAKLRVLASLREEGLISADEFTRKRAILLARIA